MGNIDFNQIYFYVQVPAHHLLRYKLVLKSHRAEKSMTQESMPLDNLNMKLKICAEKGLSKMLSNSMCTINLSLWDSVTHNSFITFWLCRFLKLHPFLCFTSTSCCQIQLYSFPFLLDIQQEESNILICDALLQAESLVYVCAKVWPVSLKGFAFTNSANLIKIYPVLLKKEGKFWQSEILGAE